MCAEIEKQLLRAFRKYAQRDSVEHDPIWHWLALAQPHGLPTRLLDWTFSPFVAMHFLSANADECDQDGVIWAVNYSKVHEHVPDRLQDLLRKEGASVFTAEMLIQVADSLEALERLSQSNFVLFFEPPSLDERIVNQFALFSKLKLQCAATPLLYVGMIRRAAVNFRIESKPVADALLPITKVAYCA